jgi:hypothetical protein
MRESKVEAHLRKSVETMGGWAMKFVSPGIVGVPDRVVFLPGGVSFFVELKRPRKGATEIQARRHQQMRDLGQVVWVANTIEAVDEVLWRYRPVVKTIDSLELNVRCTNCLKKAGVTTLDELAALSTEDMKRMGLRVRDIKEVHEARGDA